MNVLPSIQQYGRRTSSMDPSCTLLNRPILSRHASYPPMILQQSQLATGLIPDNQHMPDRTAPFLMKLHTMLQKEDTSILCWNKAGDAFHVLNHQRFVDEVLRKYFKHSKYASFQRQLNYFGFRKLARNCYNESTYSQVHFLRDNIKAMVHIKRQSTTRQRRNKEKRMISPNGSTSGSTSGSSSGSNNSFESTTESKQIRSSQVRPSSHRIGSNSISITLPEIQNKHFHTPIVHYDSNGNPIRFNNLFSK